MHAYSSLDGVILSYTHGTTGCNGVSRAINITFKCTPGAGVGYPEPPSTNYIEGPSCYYNIIWESEYGVKTCLSRSCNYLVSSVLFSPLLLLSHYLRRWFSSKDLLLARKPQAVPWRCFSSCYRDYLWKLLYEWPVKFLMRLASTTMCSPGSYVTSEGLCEQCDPGTYSIGPGNYYDEFTSVPAEFVNSCSGTGCQGLCLTSILLICIKRICTFWRRTCIYCWYFYLRTYWTIPCIWKCIFHL